MRTDRPTRFVCTTLLLAGGLAAQNWTQSAAPASPAPSTFPRMAFDSVRGQTVMFGGWNAPLGTIVFADTWEYDGATWAQRSPATVPDERDSHAMAFDLARGRTVMFGGWDFAFTLLNQTWEWDGTNWTNVASANAPSGRTLPAMAYDTARGVTVLFGGEDAVGLRGDTWEWNGTNWTQRTPASSPSARTTAAMAYDLARGRVVLFGGDDGNAVLGDTWEYDGTDWVQRITDGAPPARVDAQLVYDTARGRCVLFGGANLAGDRNDTWEWDGTRWYELFTANRPQPNAAMAMAYDLTRSRTVMFGGFDGAAALGETWELGGVASTWRTFGTGCVGGNNLTPRLEPVTVPALGSTASMNITGLPPGGGIAALAGGVSNQTWLGLPLPLDLTAAGLNGCRLYASPDALVALVHSNGTANFSLPVPNNPAIAGFTMYLQALSLDANAPRPFGGALSNAAEFNVR